METQLSAANWVPVSVLCDLAGISRVTASAALRKCFAGGTWNGAALQVRKNGRAYEVHAASLPLALYTKFRDQHPDLFKPAPLPVQQCQADENVDMTRVAMLLRHQREAEWKAGLIAKALDYRPHTPARSMVLRQIAEQTHIRPTDGKPVTFSVAKLREFCAAFEADGVRGLVRKPREKEATHRYIINRKWDQACPLPEFEKRQLAETVEQYVRDLWANGVPSRDKAREMASARLLELSRKAGWSEATFENCDVGQYLVERNQDYRALAVKSRHAKLHFDKHKPRIARSRDAFKPGEAIVGDVHPVDVLLRRPDGSEYTARMIAWYCLGTNRFHYTLLHPGQRQAVTQADVARSFFELCQDWGVPSVLYLDNGSEYKWDEMMDGFVLFSRLVRDLQVKVESIEALQAQFAEAGPDGESAEDETPGETLPASVEGEHRALVRAKPYNAPAKPIEGAFSALEKVISMMPGYIGGDRMAKRLSNVGRRPDVFPGDPEAFDAAFAEAVRMYHNTPQRGFLKGMTPNEKAAAMAGHPKTIAAEIVFRMAFAEERRPKVQTGGIEVDGRWYYDDALIPHATQRVLVRYAKWAPDVVILVRDRARPGLPQYALVRERQVFGMFDPAGAVEASRRESVQNRHYRSLRADSRRLDMLEEMQRYNHVKQELLEEKAGSAEAAVTREIGMTADLGDLQRQLAEPNPNPVERKGAGDLMDGRGVIHSTPTREEILKEREAERAAKAKKNSILDTYPKAPQPQPQKISVVPDREMEESKKVREEAERKRKLNGR